MAAQAGPRVDVFSGAREELERMIGKLRECEARPHTDVIEELREGGAEVQRRLLQGWLDRLLVQEREERPTWVLVEGAQVRERERGLEVDFGRVCVRRHGITMPGETKVKFPVDGQLNLPSELYALSLREEIATAAVEASFDRSVARVDEATAGHVPKRQAEQLVIRAAADFETFYATRAVPANDALTPQAFQLMSSDGKGVTMRPVWPVGSRAGARAPPAMTCAPTFTCNTMTALCQSFSGGPCYAPTDCPSNQCNAGVCL